MIFFELIGIFVCILILEAVFVLFAAALFCDRSHFEPDIEDFFVPLLLLVIVLTFLCTYCTYKDITTYNNEKMEVETKGN